MWAVLQSSESFLSTKSPPPDAFSRLSRQNIISPRQSPGGLSPSTSERGPCSGNAVPSCSVPAPSHPPGTPAAPVHACPRPLRTALSPATCAGALPVERGVEEDTRCSNYDFHLAFRDGWPRRRRRSASKLSGHATSLATPSAMHEVHLLSGSCPILGQHRARELPPAPAAPGRDSATLAGNVPEIHGWVYAWQQKKR